MTILNMKSWQGDTSVMDAPERSAAELLLDHPLALGLAVRTQPSIEAMLECKRIAAAGGSAFTLVGQPGAGRKSAARVIATELRQEFRHLPIIEHALPRMPPDKRVERWQALLLSCGNQHILLRSGTVLKARVMQSMLDIARRQGGLGTILMVVHNFEWLDDLWSSILLDLRDALSAEGHRLFLLNIASVAHMMQAACKLDDACLTHEIGGLIGSTCALRHLSTHEDFAQLFSEIDAQCFPRGTDCSWLAFYLPRTWHSGVRLATFAHDFHKAYNRFVGEHGPLVTTRAIFSVIRIVLTYQAGNDKAGLELREDVWFAGFERAASIFPSQLVLGNEEPQ